MRLLRRQLILIKIKVKKTINESNKKKEDLGYKKAADNKKKN